MSMLSSEATKIASAYDERAGVVRKWIMRNPNTTFYASFGAVALAFWLGIKWAKVTMYLFG